MNLYICRGRLGQAPEGKDAGRQRVVEFSVATERGYKDERGDWKTETDWIDCQAWGRLAEAIERYLGKGSQVLVRGRLKKEKWETSEGQKRSRLRVIAEQVDFLDPPRDGDSDRDRGDRGDAYEDDRDRGRDRDQDRDRGRDRDSSRRSR